MMRDAKYSHVTVIIDDGHSATIIDIPKMENVDVDTKLEEADFAFAEDTVSVTSPVISEISITGKPIKTKDGVLYTVISRNKDD